MSELRRAVIERHDSRPTPETVGRYLPGNYKVVKVTSTCITVEGRDNAGWTLEDYVIPRLGSGLIHAREVTE